MAYPEQKERNDALVHRDDCSTKFSFYLIQKISEHRMCAAHIFVCFSTAMWTLKYAIKMRIAIVEY